jgi:flagellar basal-body rod protein FlgB
VLALETKLEHYLDLLTARQRLSASNIANLDTPGYRTRDIDFQFEFMSLAEDGSPPAAPHVVEPEGLAGKNDGNNVSLDRETRLLAENALRFQFASQLLKHELSHLRSAIHGGAR